MLARRPPAILQRQRVGVRRDISAVGSNLRVARIDSLFENHTRDYSLHPDGKRFALLREVGEGLKLVVVTNWLSEAKAKLEKR